MADKFVTVAYEPNNDDDDDDDEKKLKLKRKVLFGKYIFPGETRRITAKQAKQIENDEELRVVREEKAKAGPPQRGIFARQREGPPASAAGEASPEPPVG